MQKKFPLRVCLVIETKEILPLIDLFYKISSELTFNWIKVSSIEHKMFNIINKCKIIKLIYHIRFPFKN